MNREVIKVAKADVEGVEEPARGSKEETKPPGRERRSVVRTRLATLPSIVGRYATSSGTDLIIFLSQS